MQNELLHSDFYRLFLEWNLLDSSRQSRAHKRLFRSTPRNDGCGRDMEMTVLLRTGDRKGLEEVNGEE